MDGFSSGWVVSGWLGFGVGPLLFRSAFMAIIVMITVIMIGKKIQRKIFLVLR